MAIKKEKPTSKRDIQPTQTSQIFDVARPGALPPASATTRPVIISNRTVMQDPMMVSSPPSVITVTDESVSSPARKSAEKVVSPIGESDSPPPAKESQGIKVSVDSDSDGDGLVNQPQPAPAEGPAVAGAVAPEVPAQPEAKPADQPADDQATADTPEAEKNDLDKEAADLEATAKAQEEYDALIDEKTYFLPINAVEQRRSRHVFIFGFILILVLAAAWLNIAMDAGFVSIPGVKPLTHFFQN